MSNAPTPYFQAPAKVANVKRAMPLRASLSRASKSGYRYACAKQCPNCGGRLMRTSRRIQDRLWSLVVPLKRFRCDRFSCQWVGNIERTTGTDRRRLWLENGSPRRTMVFAFAGMLALTLYVATIPFV